MKSNSSSVKSSQVKVSKVLKSLPPPISYIGVLLEFLGLKGFLIFLSGFVLMNVFIYFDYVPWGKLIDYRTRQSIEKLEKEKAKLRTGLEEAESEIRRLEDTTESEKKEKYFLSGNIMDTESEYLEDATVRAKKDAAMIEEETDDLGRFYMDLGER